MTEREPVALQNTAGLSAEELRALFAGAFGARFGEAFTPAVQSVDTGGGHGVVGSGDLAVTAGATTTVDAARGMAIVRGSSQADQCSYVCPNDATVNLAVTASDPTNDRNDLVIAEVRDAEYSGASNDWQLRVVAGTPAGSPTDPAVPASSLVLARLVVHAGDTASSQYTITDLRTRAYSVGGVCVCTSTTRPSPVALGAGQLIYETDTDRLYMYDGAAWRYVGDDAGEEVVYAQHTPAGNSDTTNASYTDWSGTVNVTVPPWASKAVVSCSIAGVFSITATGDPILVRATLGAVNSDPIQLTTTTASVRTTYSLVKQLTSISTGTQALGLEAQRVSGTGALRADTNSDFDFVVRFLP